MLRDAIEGNQLENVRKLYESSFPKSEKKPFALMLKKREEGYFDILAIEDGKGNFCGLAIMMLSGGWALLDYLAIEPCCQGTGVGSGTLRELQERYGASRIVVEIESTIDTCPDSAEAAVNAKEPVENRRERVRRKAFYLRNGMVAMDFLVNLFDVEMEVLTFGSRLTFEEYRSIYSSVLPENMAKKVKLKSIQS